MREDDDKGAYAASLQRFHRSTPSIRQAVDAVKFADQERYGIKDGEKAAAKDEDLIEWAEEEEEEHEHGEDGVLGSAVSAAKAGHAAGTKIAEGRVPGVDESTEEMKARLEKKYGKTPQRGREQTPKEKERYQYAERSNYAAPKDDPGR